jgi:predicted chitinase
MSKQYIILLSFVLLLLTFLSLFSLQARAETVAMANLGSGKAALLRSILIKKLITSKIEKLKAEQKVEAKKKMEEEKTSREASIIDARYKVPKLDLLNADEQLIVNTCRSDEFKFTDNAQLSYILATASHESGSFKYVEEINGRQQARRLGYKGGENYFGRGFLQLTHSYNYKKIGDLLGVDLLNNPHLVAEDKQLASRILCLWFTTYQHPIDKFVNQNKIDYWSARSLVNGDGWLVADKIANKAMEYYNKFTI